MTKQQSGTTQQDGAFLREAVEAWVALGLPREAAEKEVREACGSTTRGLSEGIRTSGPSRAVELRDSVGGQILPRSTPRGPVTPAATRAPAESSRPMTEAEQAEAVRAWMALGLSEAAAKAAVKGEL